MTKPLSERVAEFAGFDADLYSENSASWIFGAQAENTRLIPLITAMASEIERLREALGFYANKNNWCFYFGEAEISNHIDIDLRDIENDFGGKRARQALTTQTALDALLRGES